MITPREYSCFKNVDHEPEPFRPNFFFKEKTAMKKQAKLYYQEMIMMYVFWLSDAAWKRRERVR